MSRASNHSDSKNTKKKKKKSGLVVSHGSLEIPLALFLVVYFIWVCDEALYLSF